MLCHDLEWYLQSPQEIGSYFAGFSADVQDGTTPSTQLKFKPELEISKMMTQTQVVDLPKKNGIDTRSTVALLYTLWTVLIYMSLQSLIMKSPMFTTMVPSTGTALIHWPSLFKTCSPPTMSCQSRVNSWRSVWLPRPTELFAFSSAVVVG